MSVPVTMRALQQMSLNGPAGIAPDHRRAGTGPGPREVLILVIRPITSENNRSNRHEH